MIRQSQESKLSHIKTLLTEFKRRHFTKLCMAYELTELMSNCALIYTFQPIIIQQNHHHDSQLNIEQQYYYHNHKNYMFPFQMMQPAITTLWVLDIIKMIILYKKDIFQLSFGLAMGAVIIDLLILNDFHWYSIFYYVLQFLSIFNDPLLGSSQKNEKFHNSSLFNSNNNIAILKQGNTLNGNVNLRNFSDNIYGNNNGAMPFVYLFRIFKIYTVSKELYRQINSYWRYRKNSYLHNSEEQNIQYGQINNLQQKEEKIIDGNQDNKKNQNQQIKQKVLHKKQKQMISSYKNQGKTGNNNMTCQSQKLKEQQIEQQNQQFEEAQVTQLTINNTQKNKKNKHNQQKQKTQFQQEKVTYKKFSVDTDINCNSGCETSCDVASACEGNSNNIQQLVLKGQNLNHQQFQRQIVDESVEITNQKQHQKIYQIKDNQTNNNQISKKTVSLEQNGENNQKKENGRIKQQCQLQEIIPQKFKLEDNQHEKNQNQQQQQILQNSSKQKNTENSEIKQNTQNSNIQSLNKLNKKIVQKRPKTHTQNQQKQIQEEEEQQQLQSKKQTQQCTKNEIQKKQKQTPKNKITKLKSGVSFESGLEEQDASINEKQKNQTDLIDNIDREKKIKGNCNKNKKQENQILREVNYYSSDPILEFLAVGPLQNNPNSQNQQNNCKQNFLNSQQQTDIVQNLNIINNPNQNFLFPNFGNYNSSNNNIDQLKNNNKNCMENELLKTLAPENFLTTTATTNTINTQEDMPTLISSSSENNDSQKNFKCGSFQFTSPTSQISTDPHLEQEEEDGYYNSFIGKNSQHEIINSEDGETDFGELDYQFMNYFNNNSSCNNNYYFENEADLATQTPQQFIFKLDMDSESIEVEANNLLELNSLIDTLCEHHQIDEITVVMSKMMYMKQLLNCQDLQAYKTQIYSLLNMYIEQFRIIQTQQQDEELYLLGY